MKNHLMMGCIGLFMVACESPAVTEEALAEKEAAIREMVGDASCDDESACASMAFGAKPCGGPWEYLVYCADSVDEDALQNSVDEYFEMNQQYNMDNGVTSDCAMVEAPELELYEGICMIVQYG